jgi:hypothetical protein
MYVIIEQGYISYGYRGGKMNTHSMWWSILFVSILALRGFSAQKIIVPDNAESIQEAVDKSEEGDTIFIRNGIYKEKLSLQDNIFLIGEDIEKTIISGSQRKPVIKGADNVVIRNLTIRGGKTGILSDNRQMLLENLNVCENKETGIHCLVSLPEIRNSIICRNKWSGIYCESVRSIDPAIRHCVIAENGYSGCMLAGKTEILIENNIFFNNKQFAIWVSENSKRSRIVYNNIYGNRKPFNSTAVVNQTNVSIDPQFEPVAPSTYNYRSPVNAQLEGKGSDGADIGLIESEKLQKMVEDTDNDGIGQDSDKCPTIAEDIDGFEDDDGCPDFDNDQDDIYDAEDQCPDEAEDRDGYMDNDGCPDVDNDNYGICDPWVKQNGLEKKYEKICVGSDMCPNLAETKNSFKDDDGCPDEAPAKGADTTK